MTRATTAHGWLRSGQADDGRPRRSVSDARGQTNQQRPPWQRAFWLKRGQDWLTDRKMRPMPRLHRHFAGHAMAPGARVLVALCRALPEIGWLRGQFCAVAGLAKGRVFGVPGQMGALHNCTARCVEPSHGGKASQGQGPRHVWHQAAALVGRLRPGRSFCHAWKARSFMMT